MSEERTVHKVTFDLEAYRRRLERQGAIAFDDIEFLIDELAAAHERADKAETARRAWTELGAREQAGAALLRQALDEAIALCHVPERNQDEEWHERLSRASDALAATDAGAALLAELEAARAVVERARAAAAASLFLGRGPLVTALAAYEATKASQP